MQDTRCKKIEQMETRINRNFYHICSGVTVLTMIMVGIEFFTKGTFPPSEIGMFYLGILLIYSLHKEFVRWMGENNVKRQGEFFVYGWIAFTTVLYLINFLTKNHFSYAADGTHLETVKESCTLTIEVLIIFTVTRVSKLIRISLSKNKKV